jgi:deoxyribodipyrimidine photo-lyase
VKQPLVIYWSRRDFRLTDNPALCRALEKSVSKNIPFLPLFILEDYMLDAKPELQFGFPSRWFLAQALPMFAKRFARFVIVRGKAAQYLTELNREYELHVFVNDDVYPDFKAQIEKIRAHGVNVTVTSDALTVSPETRTGQGGIYSVFTPFKKAVWNEFVSAQPLKAPDVTNVLYADVSLPNAIHADALTLWDTFSHVRTFRVGEHIIDQETLMPLPNLEGWYVSEESAMNRFKRFLEYDLLATYDSGRDSLEADVALTERADGALQGRTSRMSLALTWGLISPRTLVLMLKEYFDESFDNPFSDRVNQGALTYISELIWREFYRYLFFHNPSLMHAEFQERFRGTITWVEDAEAYDRFMCWMRGETGYPIVDAAMRQLASMGWMHNRARMIVASVLTKNLGVDWRWGQEYFRAALIDLDEASNNGGWQWGASVGADPKPIRIFNPELQAKSHDGSGAYRREWLPKNDSFMQNEMVPIVDHKVAREEALKRYGLTKETPRDY